MSLDFGDIFKPKKESMVDLDKLVDGLDEHATRQVVNMYELLCTMGIEAEKPDRINMETLDKKDYVGITDSLISQHKGFEDSLKIVRDRLKNYFGKGHDIEMLMTVSGVTGLDEATLKEHVKMMLKPVFDGSRNLADIQ